MRLFFLNTRAGVSLARWIVPCLSLGLFFLGTVLPSRPAMSAVIELVNEDRITGEILSLDEGILELRTESMGDVRIPWSKVMRLESEEPMQLEFQDGRRVLGDFVIVGPPVPVHPDSPITMLDKSRISRILKVPEDDYTEYSGRANIGGAFYRGNSEENKLNIDAELVARQLESRYTLGVVVNEGRSTGVKTTADRMVSAQYDAFYSQNDYLFVKALAKQDDLEDLRLRSTLGVGYGRQLIESRKRNLAVEVGLSAIKEDYSLSPDKEFPSLGLVVKFDRRLFDDAVKVFNFADYSVNLDDSKDSVFKNRSGFRIPIAKGLNFSTQLEFEYDNLPALNQKKTDSSLLFSVGLGF